MMKNNSLTNKLAVVTGGSRSLGFHIAGALHQAGATVVITGRNDSTLQAAKSSIGENCHTFVCDHRNPDSISKLANEVTKTLGTPDILINNAGSIQKSPVSEMALELWNEVIETNLTGVFLTTKAFLSGMVEKNRGDVFMISSMSGKKGDPGASAYAASKFGLQGFSQALNQEVRKNNIRVMVLNPSVINTGEDNGPKEGSGLYLHAADIADLIANLASMPGRTMVRDMDIWGTNPF